MPTITADKTYYIDHSADPDFTPGSFISFKPENLKWDDQIGNEVGNGVGNCSYEISFSATDVDNNPIVTGHDFIGPYRDYYRLRYGDITIQAGVIISHHTGLGDDFMSVAGKTWEHYFERWQYPFDPRTFPFHVDDFVFPNTYENDELIASGSSTPTGLVYQAFNRDLIRIFSDLISEIMNSVPHRIIFDISNLAGLSGIKTNYQLSLGDTSFFDSMISALANTGNGFDWWISWDRKIYWATPYRFGNPSAPSLIYTLDNSKTKPEDLGFTNNGPDATHILGTGAGLASQNRLGRAYGYGPAQTQFSRLDQTYDFGDVRNVDQLILKSQKQLARSLQPKHDIPLKIAPENINGMTVRDFWSTWRKGRAIWITYDLTSHMIDSGQQLRSYSATMDNATGQVLIDYTLDQIYDLAISAGTAEG